ncbi:MAG: hypothetical protein GWP61_11675 [Chloroflexi bacterium]|jgi:hypothetical protein|nr:hypothetical protein [Chloroflexota bacterium]
MFSFSIKKTFSQQFDKLVLYSLNRRMPDSFDDSYMATAALEEVLDQTRVNRQKTALYNLVAPGEHAVWLDTLFGEIRCLVKVRPAVQPGAPLLLYHHGFAEIPYTSTWERLIPKSEPFPAHTVAVQAPYHKSLTEPVSTGFSSVQHIYQMFAGSLRTMELLQEQFAQEGAAFTAVSGLSWGGITSLLYEGFFQRTRAVIPLFASPNLAQVLSDAARLFNRPLPISRDQLDDLLDFTPYYERCDKERVFPVLGEDDLFFRFEQHAVVYPQETLVALPSTHVGAMWRTKQRLRRHVTEILAWAALHAR